MKRLNLIVMVGLIAAGLVSICVVLFPQVKNQASSFNPTSQNTTEVVSADLKSFYNQKPVWSNCEGENKQARCGSILVPTDWSNPSEGSIPIAVAINPAKDPQNAPYLLMNPGGPGSSGRVWVTTYINGLGTQKLKDTYNIVGFDPRGVGMSASINCYSPPKLKSFLYDPSPYAFGSNEDLEYSKKVIKDFGAACLKNTGNLLAHVDTSSAAKDMDVIRAVLGSKKLNYLGFSYGTLLGITYANFYPKNVGRFVLDGVVDPTVKPEADSLNQLKGFQSAMSAYLADCIKNVKDCPFKGLTVTQAMDKIGSDFLIPLETKSAYTSLNGRKLSINAGFTGIIAALYSKESWQYLTQAFNEFWAKKAPDGRIFLLLADSYFGYDQKSDSFESNDNEAFKAISCIDSRESDKLSDMLAQNKKALSISKVFGRYWQYGGLSCYNWPVAQVAGPKDYSAKSAPTMLVVGTTNDPATPYSQAVNAAHKVLAHGWLLTYKGEGHTAYGSSNTCIANTVDDFLVSGKLPTKEKTC